VNAVKLLKRIKIVYKKIRGDILFTRDFLGDRYQIGEYTYGKPKVIHGGKKTSLTIGKYCSLSTHIVIFLGGDHRVDWISTYPFPLLWEHARSITGHPSTGGNVVIGNDVWIGYNVTILSGVKIGDGAVIGTGSLVTHDVPPYAIAAGNPARIVRYRFSEEAIEKLLQIKWWDWPDEKVKENVHLICCNSVDAFIKKFG
jgi:acetyltransferase-like isoleucine patch superfamily enzyme